MIPRRIGEYEIERELGRGAMGVVYAARHPEIPRPLALKLLRGELAEVIDLLRFRREAEMLAKIKHPNVVTIHALEELPEGLFLVTDLVEGRDLEGVLREGPMPASRAAGIVSDLADGVAALHELGILHRDLKPANALITPDGTPVLIDFGLAREQVGDRLTRTGELIGTPAYMSPEQASGTTQLGPTCDVYGLGAILFALLCGRPPFTGVGVLDVLTQVTTKGVDPPSRHGDVPAELEAIVLKAMARQPEHRYPDAPSLRDALSEFLLGPREPPSSPAVPIALAALALLALIAVGAWAMRGPTESGPPQPPAPTSSALPTPPPEPLTDLIARASKLRDGEARLVAWRSIAPRLETPEAASLPLTSRRAIAELRGAPLVTLEKVGAGLPRLGVLLPDDRVLAAAVGSVRGCTIGVWERSGEPQRAPRWTARDVSALLPLGRGFVFADGLRLYLVDDLVTPDKRRLWAVPATSKLQEDRNSRIKSLAYAPNAGLLAVGGDFDEVYLVDPRSGKTQIVVGGHSAGDTRSLGFTQDERYFITMTSGTTFAGVRIYELATLYKPPPEGEKHHLISGGQFISSALRLAIAPTGTLIAVGNRRGELHLLDAALRHKESYLGTLATEHPWLSRAHRHRPRAHAGEIAGLTFLSESHLLSVGKVSMGKPYHRNKIREWDLLERKERPKTERSLQFRPEEADPSPDRRLLLIKRTDKGLEIWAR